MAHEWQNSKKETGIRVNTGMARIKYFIMCY